MEAEVRSSLPDLPPSSEIARLARSPSALLHHLSTMSDDEAQETPDAHEIPATEATVSQMTEATEATQATEANGVSANGAAANGDGTTGEGVTGDGTAPVVGPPVDSANAITPAPTDPRPPETIVQGDPNLN
jgi:hypothetical protein